MKAPKVFVLLPVRAFYTQVSRLWPSTVSAMQVNTRNCIYVAQSFHFATDPVTTPWLCGQLPYATLHVDVCTFTVECPTSLVRQSLTVFPFRCSHPPICSQRGSSILQIAGVSDWLAQSNHTVWDLPRIYRSQIWSHPPISIAYRPKVLIGLSWSRVGPTIIHDPYSWIVSPTCILSDNELQYRWTDIKKHCANINCKLLHPLHS